MAPLAHGADEKDEKDSELTDDRAAPNFRKAVRSDELLKVEQLLAKNPWLASVGDAQGYTAAPGNRFGL